MKHYLLGRSGRIPPGTCHTARPLPIREEATVRQYRKSTTVLTGLIVAAVMAGAYFMGRSDERAGRPFSLVKPAQAAEHPMISPLFSKI